MSDAPTPRDLPLHTRGGRKWLQDRPGRDVPVVAKVDEDGQVFIYLDFRDLLEDCLDPKYLTAVSVNFVDDKGNSTCQVQGWPLAIFKKD